MVTFYEAKKAAVSIRISGYVTEIDEYNRIKLIFLESYDNKLGDRHNTKKQLISLENKYGDKYNKKKYTPIYQTMYVCKLNDKVFVYDKNVISPVANVLNKIVDLEVKPIKYRTGWYLKVISINVIYDL